MLQNNNEKREIDECKLCGWMCEYVHSHVEYSFQNGGCAYIEALYNVKFDEDGEIIYTLKKES